MFRRLRYGLEVRLSRRRHGALPASRGWIHPSELPGPFEHAHLPPPRPVLSRRFQVAVGSAASALLATGGILLAVSATAPAGASTGPRLAASISALPSVDRVAAAAMLPLTLYQQEHLSSATAMVLPPGDLAVTTTSIPADTSVEGWSPGRGWMPLAVVGRDTALGVTVLRLPLTLQSTPVAPLDPAVETGGAPTRLTALAAIPGATTAVEFEYGPAFLGATPEAAFVGSTELAVISGRSNTGVISGATVLDDHGQAVAVAVPSLGSSGYVSATFVELLAQRIVLGDATGHGWLQLRGADSPAGIALVDSVARGGVSFGRVLPGDEIVAVNSQPVRTMADVDTILYATSPGVPVTLTLVRAGHLLDVGVRLAAAP